MSTVTGTLVPPGTWQVEPSRSTVGFQVRHFKLLHLRGRFHAFEGRVSCDDAGRVSVSGSVAVASVDTGDPRRDERLHTEEFFDVERHPRLRFEGGCDPHDDLTIRGTLELRGVKRPLSLRLQPPEHADGELRLRAAGSLSRRDFGLDWDPAFAAGGLVIDDRVDIRLNVVVRRAG